jgi:hypothetical protein
MLPEDAPTRQIDIAEGADILTADGDKLGTVKEVRAGYFKVNAHFQLDYWLQRQFVTSNEGGKVTMSFNKDELGDYKVTDLPDEPVYEGQDVAMRERGDATGFETEIVGGPVNNPAEGPGENPAAQTIRAVESQSRGEVER